MHRIRGFFINVKKLGLTNLNSNTIRRKKHIWKNMNCESLKPPNKVRGMIVLDKNAFNKTIEVPTLEVPEENLNKILPLVKSLLLKMEQFKPIRALSCIGERKFLKEILLHPLAVKSWNNIPKEICYFGINESNFKIKSINLTYDNWKADEILNSVLPENQEGVTSFSRIGHIVHINLKDHLTPYKQLIGKVLKDKVIGCRTVVNKDKIIDNTYRNFKLELICGDPDYRVKVKEHGCTFEFDFSKVYWNPRLSTEHDRIVNLLNNDDVLYDVFAGVGPFSIPAAKKKKCKVLANDLNPESFKWLNVNVKQNKCLHLIQTFNKDGRDFILKDVRSDLLTRWKSNKRNYSIHITMNLPAIAIEFLNAFNYLFKEEEIRNINNDDLTPLPLVHVYIFTKETNFLEKNLKKMVEHCLGNTLDSRTTEIHFVRNVAPNKDMYRVSFQLTKEILIEPMQTNKRQFPLEDEESIITDLKRKLVN